MLLQIREAVLDNLPAMLAIYNHAIAHLAATFDLEPQSLAQREVWFHKHTEAHPLLVAEADGQVVGYCCLSPFREKPAYSKTVELSVYIDAQQRGRGVGTALMSDILQRAEQLGYHTVISGITGGNEASVRLHEKFGFTLAGKFREVGFKFGEWHDVHFYQLMLGKEA
ncbi:GNAT family N-acetyltransferase [Brevibacillus agri]|uniref:GNAT family N-acetyltransferase n=1 Tax=Brevibacillus agri TaxID=51101 RepID=UPI0005681D2F|nr:GNAT family N-acetyltransferase [Brevibacillus agri]